MPWSVLFSSSQTAVGTVCQQKKIIGEKIMKQTKKGFTLVELLVVIAILAILATVSVVGYTSFITKAQISADEQAVVQMNVVLQSVQAGGEEILVDDNQGQTCINIFNNLIENGYSDEFHTYYAKHSIGYVVDHGIIYLVLVEDNAVTFPEKYAGNDYNIFFKPTNNTAEFEEALNSGFALLTQNAVFEQALKITKDVTIVGNGNVLSDDTVLNVDSSANSVIAIDNNTEAITVTMSGVTIDNSQGYYSRGLNLGYNTKKVTLILDNCNIRSLYYALNVGGFNEEGVDIIVRNSTIEGWAAANIRSRANITFENCTLIGNATSSEVFGTINIGMPATVGGETTTPIGSKLTFKNCTIEANNVQPGYGMVLFNINVDCELVLEGCTYKVNGEEIDVLQDYIKVWDTAPNASIITR